MWTCCSKVEAGENLVSGKLVQAYAVVVQVVKLIGVEVELRAGDFRKSSGGES